MRIRKHLLLPLLLTLMAGTAVNADDTDIYITDPTTGTGVAYEPLVMFILDYRPNLFSTICADVTSGCPQAAYFAGDPLLPTSGKLTFFRMLTLALKRVAAELHGVRVGFMLSHNHDNKCAGPDKTGCSNGAYIMSGFKPFVKDDANGNKAALFEQLAAIPEGGSHSFQGKEIYFELFRYLTGQGIYNGHNGWTDYGTSKNHNLPADNPVISWDTGIENGGNYISPLNEHCSKVFAINLFSGTTNQEDDSDDAISATKANGGMNALTAKGKLRFEDVVSWMYNVDLANGTYGTAPDLRDKQNVTSYFMLKGNRANVDSYAAAGGTGQVILLSEDPAELVATLNDVFKQILSVSTTFVAASVPVNVFSRAEILDSVYIALFQAEPSARWPGNLKKLKFNADRTLLLDALGNNAVATDGRIAFNALTFWTNSGALPPPDPDKNEVAGRDGRSVTRGAAGQKIPGFIADAIGESNGTGTRRLFTEPDNHVNGTPTALRALNADAATASVLQDALQAQNSNEALCLLRYIRGFDVATNCASTAVRPWLMGDALHSRPLPINYGARGSYTQDNPDVRIVMGTNGGFLHMFRDILPGGSEDGREVWAFMPRAVMPIMKTLKNNSAGDRHPYGVDGAPVAYIDDKNYNGTIDPGDKVYLYFGLRRGGKAYYALDISDPDNPRMLWSITKGGDFAELGMTFSAPRVAMVDYGAGVKPVLIFGGGYDTNKDNVGIGTNDTEGNALYIVDAETGALVWKAVKSGTSGTKVRVHPELNDSIPSEVTTVDSDGDGLVDRVYVGDTGGVIWRADIAGNDSSKWTLTKLLSVGRHAMGGAENDRRFFHRPDFVMAKDATGAFDAVIIGSGDRAHPLETTVKNEFYMIKDRVIVSGSQPATIAYGNLYDVTQICNLGCSLPANADLHNGWRMSLVDPVDLSLTGEKSLATPLTISGSIYFTTYFPPGSPASGTDSCGPAEGSGRMYRVALQNAFAVHNYDLNNDEDEIILAEEDRYMDLDSGGIPAEVISIPPDKILTPDLRTHDTGAKGAWRTFWYQSEQ